MVLGVRAAKADGAQLLSHSLSPPLPTLREATKVVNKSIDFISRLS